MSERQTPGNGYMFTAMPNIKAPVKNRIAQNPPFDNVTWAVPARGSTSHAVGFIEDSTIPSNVRAEGFLLSGGWFRLIESNNHILSAVYCAFPTAVSGVWSLSWNETSDKTGGIPIYLRTTPYPAGQAPPNDLPTSCQPLR
jgi:hypothetical protein